MNFNLKSDHGTFLCAEEGGGEQFEVVSAPEGKTYPAGLLTATRESAGGWETFILVENEDGTYALRSLDKNKALCCENAEDDNNAGRPSLLVFNRDTIGAWESFKLWFHDKDRVSFESVVRPGWFIKAFPDGTVRLDQPMFEDMPSETPGGYETFVSDPPLRQTPTTARPPQGMSRLDGRGYADDGGNFLGLVATHMDAVHCLAEDKTRFDDNLDYLASLSMHQRVLGILGWQGEEVDPRDPDYWQRLHHVFDAAYALGIRTHFTVLADLYLVPELHDQGRRMKYAQFVVDQLRDRRHMLLSIEGCNEPGNGDLWANWGTAEELVEFTRHVGEGLGVPWGAGALYGGIGSSTSWWTGNENDPIAREAQTLIDGCPAVSMHLDRGVGAEGLWRPVRQAQEGKNTAGNKMWWDNEPVGYDSSVTWYNMGSPTTMDPDHRTLHRIAAMTSFICGAALYCWHTEGGTGYSSDRPIRGEHGGPECAAARDILPPDLPNWDYHNWHWPSNPVETPEGCVYDHDMQGRGTLRTIAATRGEDVIVYPFCIPEGATLKAKHAMHLTKYQFIEGRYQPVQELALGAGQTWEQERAFETLYKGIFI